MTNLVFSSDMPIIYYDESLKAHLKLTASWEVGSEADEDYEKSTVRFFVMNMLVDMLREYQRTVPFEQLSERYSEIDSAVSEKLTEKMRFPCSAKLTALTPDEESARILELRSMLPEEQHKALIGNIVHDDRAYNPNEPAPVGMMGIPVNDPPRQRLKFCPDCGTPLQAPAKFCGNCGKAII